MHVAVPGAVIANGLQVTDFSAADVVEFVTASVPPVAVVGIALPARDALTAPVTATGTAALEGAADNWIATFATTPFAIVLELTPVSRHIVDPVVVRHWTALPAAVAAAPAVTATEVISEDE